MEEWQKGGERVNDRHGMNKAGLVNSVEWEGGFVLDAPLPRICMSAITRSEERSRREGRKGMGWTRDKVVMILSVRGDSVFRVFDRDREGRPAVESCKMACKIARMC